MKCNNCGLEIKTNAKFCPKCGGRLEDVSGDATMSVDNAILHDISTIWPEWQIERRIGKGAYGVVYKAIRRDNNVESSAAIKVVSISADSSELDSLYSEGLDFEKTKAYYNGVLDEFVSEIQLMESFKGVQNIVSVEDYKVVEKSDSIGWDIYIRMEFLTPLNTYTRGRELSQDDIIKLGQDICAALEICSQRNVVHRDIKPENIFINDFGHFKLGDFGIARKLENVTSGLSQKGTYNYMAPEVANSKDYDARVDTYSLGIVLYRLLNNNRLPFIETEEQLLNPNERRQAVDRRIRGEELAAPCNASPEMADLILRACSYNPDNRFASASEMKKALASVADGTYEISGLALDKTTSIRDGAVDYDATMSVRGSMGATEQGGEPFVDTFDEPKKKRSKAKIIVISVISAIILLAIILTICFFTSAPYDIYKDVQAQKYSSALATYRRDVKDTFINEMLLNSLLDEEVEQAAENFNSGKWDYYAAKNHLDALDTMGFENAKTKLDEITESYANSIVTKYQSGEMTYDQAVAEINTLKSDGYAKADEILSQIAAIENSNTSLEKGNEHYENGDYEEAIEELSKIPEGSDNYDEAQETLTQAYKAYIDSTVDAIKKYNSQKKYKDAVQRANIAYNILPDSVDTKEIDTAKEEALAAYKTEVANEVSDLIDDGDFVGAFSEIDEAISFDDNEYFHNLRSSTEEKYVATISTTVQKHMNNEDYISARRVVENALTVLPDNEALESLKKDVENKTPTYLLDVCKPYESSGYKEYINGETITMAGKSYTNGFRISTGYNSGYSIFNVDSQYLSLGFMVGHVDGTGMESAKLKIYCDGVLKKELDLKSDAMPQKITVDITGVSQLKFVLSGYYADYGFVNVTVK